MTSLAIGDYAQLQGEPVTVIARSAHHIYYIPGHAPWGCASEELFDDPK